MKIKVNGKEIEDVEPLRNGLGESSNLSRDNELEEQIALVKGLATGEAIHWVLLE